MNIYRVQLDTVFDGHSTMTFLNNSHGFKGGLDYYAGSRSVIGVMVNGNISDNDFSNLSKTRIYYQPTGITDRLLVADNSSQSKRNNINFNANYRYADTANRTLNIDADYGFYDIKSNQVQPNYYYDSTGTVLQSQLVYNMIAPTNIDMYSLKADYEQDYKRAGLV